jgi:hypothetical protein
MVFTTIGKFVAFMFRKTHFETVIADVFYFGTFMRNCTIGNIGETEFIPSTLLQQETKVFKSQTMDVKEPTQKQELHIARIAQVCQISEELTQQILKLINKAIVSE